MRVLSLLFLISLYSCDLNNTSKSHKNIKEEINNLMFTNKIEIKDKTDLDLFVYTNFISKESLNNDNVISLIGYAVSKKYRPNVLSMNKLVNIKILDTLKNSYSKTYKISTLFEQSEVLDKALSDLDDIVSIPRKNKFIETMLSKNCCDKKLKFDKEIKSAYFNGVRKSKQIEYKYIVKLSITSEKSYAVELFYDWKNELLKINCCVNDTNEVLTHN